MEEMWYRLTPEETAARLQSDLYSGMGRKKAKKDVSGTVKIKFIRFPNFHFISALKAC